SDDTRHVIAADAPLPTARRVSLRFEFTKTGHRRGLGALLVDGRRVASGEIAKTWPVAGLAGGLYCGRDGGSPVSDAYEPPFAFSGTLHQVIVELGDDGTADPAGEFR